MCDPEAGMQPIYLDYNATTPTDPAVVEELSPYLTGEFGNPSSSHTYGKKAKEAVEAARARVATLLGCDLSEVIFTSGGTESNNQALIGTALANADRGKHLVTTTIEHPAVINPLHWLEGQGFTVTYAAVDGTGRVDPRAISRAITGETIIISVMHANNEVGTIQPLAEIGEIASEKGIIFHTDAAQSVGKIPVRVDDLQVDLLSVAGHKLYAPKGVGALFIRRGIKINSYLHGAGQEGGRRAGTENVPSIAALGKAAELAAQRLAADGARILSLRERLHNWLRESVDGVVLNGHPTERLPNTLNVSFGGVVGADVLAQTPEIAASVGSACHEGSGDLSGVLKAMGIAPDLGFGAVRLSLGRFTTTDEIDRAGEALVMKIKQLRSTRP
jgi:cysteine desulfurase